MIRNPRLDRARKVYRYVISSARDATRVTNSKAAALKIAKALQKKDPKTQVDIYDEETGKFITFKALKQYWENPGIKKGAWTPCKAVKIANGKLLIRK